MKVAVITGGSSGIGLCTARALAEKGVKVYELSRRPFHDAALTHLCCDITNETMVADAIRTVLAAEGRIDILINNAGFGISGAVEFTDTQEAKRLFDVDFFGMVRVNRAVIPVMREQGCGTIVNLSSVAASVPIPFQAYYSAAKAAISAYTLALGNELRRFSIRVCAVLPGDIRTGFTAARQKSAEGDEVYGGSIQHSVAKMEHDEQNGMPPEAAGRKIARIALKKRGKPLYTIGFAYQCVILLTKLLPTRLWNAIVRKIYA